MTDHRPILIAGPTASGKSALALRLAAACDGIVINADALQVYGGWRILSARPSDEDEARAPHALYGHVAMDVAYSVGHWLRDLRRVLAATGQRPIIIGGTGLYFSALTEGLVDIPAIPAEVRLRGDALRARGAAALASALATRDPDILARIDTNNPARLQRAWEVHEATGRPLSHWQQATGPADLPLGQCVPLCLVPDVAWLNDRIARRFDQMLDMGAIDEVAAQRRAGLDMACPAARALGAAELMAYLGGEIDLDRARDLATIATRQFAKRQRTWFRTRMEEWGKITLDGSTDADHLAARAMDIIARFG